MITRIRNLFRRAVEHHGLRKYGANMSWLFAEKLLRMAIGFTVGVYVARQLGPERYGTLNYAISFAAIFSCLVSLGLDQIMVRELVIYPEKRNELMGTALMLRLAGFILMLSGVGVGLLLSNNDTNTNLLVLVIAGGYLFQIFQTIDFYFQAKVLSKYVAISQMVAWVIISAFRAVFAWQQAPLIYFAYLEAGNILLTAIGYLIFYILKVDSVASWRFKFTAAKFLLQNSWPLLLTGTAGMIYLRIDQVMIKSMIGDTEVGYYAVAVRLVELWYLMPMIICPSVFPAIVSAKESSSGLYHLRIRKLLTLSLLIAVAIALPTALFGKYIIIFLYGREYSAATPILIIYIWRTIFCFTGVASGYYLIAENLQKYSLIFAIMGAFVNVVLNYVLIKRLGASGSAIASLTASLIVVYVGPLMFGRTRKLGYLLLKTLSPLNIKILWS